MGIMYLVSQIRVEDKKLFRLSAFEYLISIAWLNFNFNFKIQIQ